MNLMLTFYVWQSAASVTEKCRACYSLISHVLSAESSITLQEQQVLANHIRLSDGGIRVQGMKVDRGLLIKAMSMGGNLHSCLWGSVDGIERRPQGDVAESPRRESYFEHDQVSTVQLRPQDGVGEPVHAILLFTVFFLGFKCG